MLYIMHAEINAKLGKFWHIFFMQKLYKDHNGMYFLKNLTEPYAWGKLKSATHICHLHTKSLMPPSNFFMLYAEKNFFWRLKMCSSAKHGLKLKSNQWLLYTVWLLSILWKQGFNQVWFLWAYFTTEFLIPYSPWTYHKIHDLCQFWWHTSLISNINCLGY